MKLNATTCYPTPGKRCRHPEPGPASLQVSRNMPRSPNCSCHGVSWLQMVPLSEDPDKDADGVRVCPKGTHPCPHRCSRGHRFGRGPSDGWDDPALTGGCHLLEPTEQQVVPLGLAAFLRPRVLQCSECWGQHLPLR